MIANVKCVATFCMPEFKVIIADLITTKPMLTDCAVNIYGLFIFMRLLYNNWFDWS
jgi:hypothetical protein